MGAYLDASLNFIVIIIMRNAFAMSVFIDIGIAIVIGIDADVAHYILVMLNLKKQILIFL
jgi:hypothetical protein